MNYRHVPSGLSVSAAARSPPRHQESLDLAPIGMPTDLTPAPFKYAQQFPIALEHPGNFAKMFGDQRPGGPRPEMNMGLHQYQHQANPQYFSSSPQAQCAQHLPIPQSQQRQHHQHPSPPSHAHSHSHSHSHHPPPFLGQPSLPQPVPPSLSIPHPMALHPIIQDSRPNKCLPNGVRMPYAPYAGDAYMPASEKADRMSLDRTGSPLHPVASLRSHIPNSHASSHSGSAPIPIPVAHRGSVLTPQGWAASGSAVGSVSNSMAHHGSRRVDEGWDGSQGRAHMGHMPDPTSTAGRSGRTPEGLGLGLGMLAVGGSEGWRQAPSSWQNHARLTPGLAPVAVSYVQPSLSLVQGQGQGGEHIRGRGRSASIKNPAVGDDITRPRRTSFVIPGEECQACSHSSSPTDRGKRSGSGRSQRSGSGGDIGGSRQRKLSIGQGHPPVINSPLARIAKLAIDDGAGTGMKRSSSMREGPGLGGR